MKKNLFALFSFVFFIGYADFVSSQVTTTSDMPERTETKADSIISQLNTPPSFPNGKEAMLEYIGTNLKYPKEAFKNKISGRVMVRFIVSAEGKIMNISVKEDVDTDLKEEAMRIVRNMPDWIPATNQGKAIPYQYRIPIVFNADDNLYQLVPEKKEAEFDGKAYLRLDTMPSFPGGEEAMHNFIKKNIKYPKNALKKEISGRPIIRFIVTETGKITDISVKEKGDADLDGEAMRLIKIMPDWTPGVYQGKAVPCHYTVPIIFRLGGR